MEVMRSFSYRVLQQSLIIFVIVDNTDGFQDESRRFVRLSSWKKSFWYIRNSNNTWVLLISFQLERYLFIFYPVPVNRGRIREDDKCYKLFLKIYSSRSCEKIDVHRWRCKGLTDVNSSNSLNSFWLLCFCFVFTFLTSAWSEATRTIDFIFGYRKFYNYLPKYFSRQAVRDAFAIFWIRKCTRWLSPWRQS